MGKEICNVNKSRANFSNIVVKEFSVISGSYTSTTYTWQPNLQGEFIFTITWTCCATSLHISTIYSVKIGGISKPYIYSRVTDSTTGAYTQACSLVFSGALKSGDTVTVSMDNAFSILLKIAD